jgi:hypothetical protein
MSHLTCRSMLLAILGAVAVSPVLWAASLLQEPGLGAPLDDPYGLDEDLCWLS